MTQLHVHRAINCMALCKRRTVLPRSRSVHIRCAGNFSTTDIGPLLGSRSTRPYPLYSPAEPSVTPGFADTCMSCEAPDALDGNGLDELFSAFTTALISSDGSDANAHLDGLLSKLRDQRSFQTTLQALFAADYPPPVEWLVSNIAAIQEQLPLTNADDLVNIVDSLSAAHGSWQTVLLAESGSAWKKSRCTDLLEYLRTSLARLSFYGLCRTAISKHVDVLTATQLSRLLFALGQLPTAIPLPLPIGFGTPRFATGPYTVEEAREWDACLASCFAAFECCYRRGEASSEDVASFIIGIASCRKWAMVRVDSDRLYSAEVIKGVRRTLADRHYNDFYVWGVQAMLQMQMLPPVAVLNMFYARTSDRLWRLFGLQQLLKMVAAFQLFAATPDEAWLRELVGEVHKSSHKLNEKEARSFLSGCKMFNSCLRVDWLRNFTARLEEFVCDSEYVPGM